MRKPGLLLLDISWREIFAFWMPQDCFKFSSDFSGHLFYISLCNSANIFRRKLKNTEIISYPFFVFEIMAPYFLADVHALCSFVLSFINLRYHFSYFPLSASLSPSWFFRWVLISGIIGCSFIINSNITSSNISFYLFATLSSLLQNYFLRLSIFVKCRISLSLEERRK